MLNNHKVIFKKSMGYLVLISMVLFVNSLIILFCTCNQYACLDYKIQTGKIVGYNYTVSQECQQALDSNTYWIDNMNLTDTTPVITVRITEKLYQVIPYTQYTYFHYMKKYFCSRQDIVNMYKPNTLTQIAVANVKDRNNVNNYFYNDMEAIKARNINTRLVNQLLFGSAFVSLINIILYSLYRQKSNKDNYIYSYNKKFDLPIY